MCKDCKCKKVIDFSEMAGMLLHEFGCIMPIDCKIFLNGVYSGKHFGKNWINQKGPIKTVYKAKTKYPLD